MSFVDPRFPLLALLAFCAYWAAPGARGKNVVLVGASLLIYGFVHPWMALLLLWSALLDYSAARLISERPEWRKAAMLASVVGNLGTLAAFKYLDWFVASVSAALGGDATGLLGIMMPLGISFYTFQTLGYTLDVYRGRLEARTSLLDYLAFVLFFPQLVAGPIERGTRLLPQLEGERILHWHAVRSGLSLLLWGAVLKVVVADTLAPMIDAIYALPNPAGILLWTGTLAFGVQLYADFQGYTSLARGLAQLFGIELVRNFDEPFLAKTTPEFWRRWHISMSSWLRDHMLVPLLGDQSGVSKLRIAGAVMITFVAIGMWHGPGWHYAVFGLWHGAWSLLFVWATPKLPFTVPTPLAALLHGAIVLAPGGFLFRERDVGRAFTWMITPAWEGTTNDQVVAVVLVSLTFVLGALPVGVWALRRTLSRWNTVGTAEEPMWWLPLHTTWWAVAACLLFIFHRITVTDFVYFAF